MKTMRKPLSRSDKDGHPQCGAWIERMVCVCVCLRSLAEHFKTPYFKLMYERSALQSADIYTKAFTDAVEWTRAQKLVNHLDPKLFWGERPQGYAGPLPSEHKGGVRYDYWTSNPGHSQGDAPQAASRKGAAAMRADVNNDMVKNLFNEHDYFDDIVFDDEGFADSEDDVENCAAGS